MVLVLDHHGARFKPEPLNRRHASRCSLLGGTFTGTGFGHQQGVSTVNEADLAGARFVGFSSSFTLQGSVKATLEAPSAGLWERCIRFRVRGKGRS